MRCLIFLASITALRGSAAIPVPSNNIVDAGKEMSKTFGSTSLGKWAPTASQAGTTALSVGVTKVVNDKISSDASKDSARDSMGMLEATANKDELKNDPTAQQIRNNAAIEQSKTDQRRREQNERPFPMKPIGFHNLAGIEADGAKKIAAQNAAMTAHAEHLQGGKSSAKAISNVDLPVAPPPKGTKPSAPLDKLAGQVKPMTEDQKDPAAAVAKANKQIFDNVLPMALPPPSPPRKPTAAPPTRLRSNTDEMERGMLPKPPTMSQGSGAASKQPKAGPVSSPNPPAALPKTNTKAKPPVPNKPDKLLNFKPTQTNPAPKPATPAPPKVKPAVPAKPAGLPAKIAASKPAVTAPKRSTSKSGKKP